MDKAGLIMVFPCVSVTTLDGEGVNSVEGLEMEEVRQKDIWSKYVGRSANADMSGILKKSVFARVG